MQNIAFIISELQSRRWVFHTGAPEKRGMAEVGDSISAGDASVNPDVDMHTCLLSELRKQRRGADHIILKRSNSP